MAAAQHQWPCETNNTLDYLRVQPGAETLRVQFDVSGKHRKNGFCSHSPAIAQSLAKKHFDDAVLEPDVPFGTCALLAQSQIGMRIDQPMQVGLAEWQRHDSDRAGV